jgi:prephenate dehydratase
VGAYLGKVAFQGVPGAFSDEACRSFTPEWEPVACDTFADAFDAVTSGACERALLPVHNVTAGPVEPVVRLLPASGLKVLSEHDLIVRQQLMALPGVRLEDVEVVASHPMALGQCRRFLVGLGAREEEAFDTAGAARDLSASSDRKRAVIAARAAAELYGLTILAPDIQDDPSNWTRFLFLARE